MLSKNIVVNSWNIMIHYLFRACDWKYSTTMKIHNCRAIKPNILHIFQLLVKVQHFTIHIFINLTLQITSFHLIPILCTYHHYKCGNHTCNRIYYVHFKLNFGGSGMAEGLVFVESPMQIWLKHYEIVSKWTPGCSKHKAFYRCQNYQISV